MNIIPIAKVNNTIIFNSTLTMTIPRYSRLAIGELAKLLPNGISTHKTLYPLFLIFSCMIENMKSYESSKHNALDSYNPGAKPPALSIDEKVELYHKELELEEKAEGKSKALRGGA